MASASSKKVIYTALFANAAIAVTKFVAASFNGSSAMLSEGVHSIVDTGNQGLLLYGGRRAAKPPDTAHPFGYGMELYFWTFVVAILIFAVGAGVSTYEGVHKLLDPHPIESAYVNYIVLGVAMVFEGAALYIAAKEFNKTRGRRGILAEIRASKDPTVFTVLFEDTAALLGLVAALIGIALAQALDMPIFDGIASIVIGAILATVAILLAYESKGLLIGEAAEPAVRHGVRAILLNRPELLRLNEVLTMHLGPRDILLNLSLDFRDDLSANDVEAAISALEIEIKAAYPQITRVFIEAQSWRAHEKAAETTEPS